MEESQSRTHPHSCATEQMTAEDGAWKIKKDADLKDKLCLVEI